MLERSRSASSPQPRGLGLPAGPASGAARSMPSSSSACSIALAASGRAPAAWSWRARWRSRVALGGTRVRRAGECDGENEARALRAAEAATRSRSRQGRSHRRGEGRPRRKKSRAPKKSPTQGHEGRRSQAAKTNGAATAPPSAPAADAERAQGARPATTPKIGKAAGKSARHRRVAGQVPHAEQVPRPRLLRAGLERSRAWTCPRASSASTSRTTSSPSTSPIHGKAKALAKIKTAAAKPPSASISRPTPTARARRSPGTWRRRSSRRKRPLRRLTFNEITERAVKQALEQPRELDMNLVNAQQARRVLDRLVGYKVSPFAVAARCATGCRRGACRASRCG